MRLEGESAKALLLSSCTSDRPSIDVSPRSPLFIHNCACQEAHPALSNETTKVRSAGVLAVAALMRPATLREGVLRTPCQVSVTTGEGQSASRIGCSSAATSNACLADSPKRCVLVYD